MGKRRHMDIGGADADAAHPGAKAVVHGLFDIANVAAPKDNCAVALRMLDAGTAFRVEAGGRVYKLSHQILEGHRFAIQDIDIDGMLMSWDLPFGRAVKRIAAGDYVMNPLMKTAMDGRREVTWELPSPNFADLDTSIDSAYQLDESKFVPKPSCKSTKASDATFMGYKRPDGTVGTRNHVAVISLTVHASRFARAAVKDLQASLPNVTAAYPNVDGVVCVAHNEGGGGAHQHNAELVIRALASYLVHPNLGGVLLVSTPEDRHVQLADVKSELARQGLQIPPHVVFQETTHSWGGDLALAQASVRVLLDQANATARTPQPVSALRIALQCGGSDAFSGITGNPLAGEVSKLVIEAGGAAVLAETPELVGAEPYVIEGCASLEVAREYLEMTYRYQRYAARHRQDAAGNPSGGNLFRGLYNIGIKSLGASRKKPPSVALDGCLNWGQRETQPGYYFMDSPGNDLESIAGQVATGCNMIYFITGNGAITNFPFVPTLKYVTTSGRFNLLSNDMDIDAGELNRADVTMAMKAEKTLMHTLRVAGGEKSKGELAGHYQVHMWRNWAVGEGEDVETKFENGFNHGMAALARGALACNACDVSESERASWGWVADIGRVTKGRKLVISTSLCSGQIGEIAVDRLLAARAKDDETLYSGIPHTEGCGGAGGEQLENMMARTLCGHALHPLVDATFVLEHGCEKTHNDWFLSKVGPEKETMFGWGSVQKDGGIENNVEKIEGYFAAAVPRALSAAFVLALSTGKADVGDDAARFLAVLCKKVVALGGKVVIPQTGAEGVLGNNAFTAELLQDNQPGLTIEPTISYAETVLSSAPGVHIMQTLCTMSDVEITSGLAACGASIIVNWTSGALRVGHRFVPAMSVGPSGDVDVEVDAASLNDADGGAALVLLMARAKEALAGAYVTKSNASGCVDFSIPRGTCSISL